MPDEMYTCEGVIQYRHRPFDPINWSDIPHWEENEGGSFLSKTPIQCHSYVVRQSNAFVPKITKSPKAKVV